MTDDDHTNGGGGSVPALDENTIIAEHSTDQGTAQTLALHAETAVLSKRLRKTRIHVTRTTNPYQQFVEQDLVRESVVIERVPIDRVVDAVPPIREEGDVMIVPVVEEVVVVQLVLKEEVHLRRVRTTQRHTETVTLRKQEIAVTRTALDD